MAKTDWVKLYSKTLDQEYAFDQISGWLFVRDGTKYSPEELSLLARSKNDVPLQVHIVKNVFNGTVISAPPAIPGQENLKFGKV